MVSIIITPNIAFGLWLLNGFSYFPASNFKRVSDTELIIPK